MKHAFWTALLVLANPAHANPPANANPAYEQFFESQKIPNLGGMTVSCCSVMDGREVPYKIQDGHFWVYLTQKSFPFLDEAHIGWKEVPDSQVLQGQPNPTGHAVAWVAQTDYDFDGHQFKYGDILCFLPETLV